jgi:hypothetical protein
LRKPKSHHTGQENGWEHGGKTGQQRLALPCKPNGATNRNGCCRTPSNEDRPPNVLTAFWRCLWFPIEPNRKRNQEHEAKSAHSPIGHPRIEHLFDDKKKQNPGTCPDSK